MPFKLFTLRFLRWFSGDLDLVLLLKWLNNNSHTLINCSFIFTFITTIYIYIITILLLIYFLLDALMIIFAIAVVNQTFNTQAWLVKYTLMAIIIKTMQPSTCMSAVESEH